MSAVAVYALCSVPQGSVLGLRLYLLYTADIGEVTALRDPACASDSFKQFLKTILHISTNVQRHNGDFLGEMRYINPRFTSYLLTFLRFINRTAYKLGNYKL